MNENINRWVNYTRSLLATYNFDDNMLYEVNISCDPLKTRLLEPIRTTINYHRDSDRETARRMGEIFDKDPLRTSGVHMLVYGANEPVSGFFFVL